MLSLDNPNWQDLEDAYGSAVGIPSLLKRLYENPRDGEAWNEAWSSLCHQSTIYSASIAAMPHLVSIATDQTLGDRLKPLFLVGAIAACIGKPPTNVLADSEFKAYCSEALHLLLESVERGNLGEAELRYSLSSVAALSGNSEIANVLADLDCGVVCPNCGSEIELMDSSSAK